MEDTDGVVDMDGGGDMGYGIFFEMRGKNRYKVGCF